MLENKKLKEKFCVLLNISSNLEEEKLLHRYKMFIRDIKTILKDNNFNEYEINSEVNNISINILNKTLKEIVNVFKCLAYIQIIAIEKYLMNIILTIYLYIMKIIMKMIFSILC